MLDEINLIIYIAIAITGTVFGSFFTLAVHRIPKHQDITHERSYCPKCNHKLHFLDLIPVFSYIFLGGKCRYCKEKIRPRYLILEICSGIVFLLLAFAHKINYYSSIEEWIYFCLSILFIVSMFITAGIDKEHYKIIDGVMLYGAIIGIAKICALVVFEKSIIANVIGFLIWTITYLIIRFVLSLIKVDIKNDEKTRYILDITKFLAILGLFYGAYFQAIGILLSLLCIAIYLLGLKISKKEIKVPFGFLITIAFMFLYIIYF